jgi:hypothetical protein
VVQRQPREGVSESCALGCGLIEIIGLQKFL